MNRPLFSDSRGAPSAPGEAADAALAGAGSGDAPEASPASFEQAVTELEGLVHSMESGELSLEQSLAAYRRGAALVTWARQSLSAVQQQVRILEGDLLKPFEAVAGEDA